MYDWTVWGKSGSSACSKYSIAIAFIPQDLSHPHDMLLFDQNRAVVPVSPRPIPLKTPFISSSRQPNVSPSLARYYSPIPSRSTQSHPSLHMTFQPHKLPSIPFQFGLNLRPPFILLTPPLPPLLAFLTRSLRSSPSSSLPQAHSVRTARRSSLSHSLRSIERGTHHN